MISLQPVTQENYNDCLALERTQFDFVGDAAAVLANAYIYRDSSLAYAVCEEDTVIGMVLLDETGKDHSYEFTDLFIADNYRNQGYGDKAVKAILSHFSEKGATTLHMQVHKDNKTAIHIYKKNGFSIKETSPWDDDFIVMEYTFDTGNRPKDINTFYHSTHTEIRTMAYDDIPAVCRADNDEREETVTYLKNQLVNQEKEECSALLALYHGEIAGYVFLYYRCRWGALGGQNLPGVVDLIVFEPFRQKGVATALMDVAENIARKYSDKVYLDVCLNSDYGPAQRFYVKRGYIPDGKGVYYEEKICETDAVCKNDDELTLCLIKDLQNNL